LRRLTVNKLILHSYAKLNLYLNIIGKREDNYHSLQTIFERIDLADTIILTPTPTKKINLRCSISTLPGTSANLALQSARLLREASGVGKGVDIELIKRIPVGAGLGGGSSNAACVLWGLNKLWKLRLSLDKLLVFGRKIGSDVAFFLYNCSFALGEGRGDRIKPLHLQRVKPLWQILVVPKIEVRTPLVYKEWELNWEKNRSLGLTIPKYDVRIMVSALKNRDLHRLGQGLFNSLERITQGLYPQVGLVKKKLSDLGLKSILMSGSGPAVFGVVSSKKEAVSLSRQLARVHHPKWQIFAARTI
jgi:4-diphosphocytidyl-2-C-methyl-D-erythritol kinase